MNLSSLSIIFAFALSWNFVAAANYYQTDDGGNAGDDGSSSGNAASYAQKYYSSGQKNEYYMSGGGSYSTYKGDYKKGGNITFWTEFAIQPKKCIKYGNTDMIVWSLYEKYYNHCKDSPIGTYMTDVPTFITSWIEQMELNSEDMNGDDFVLPDTTYVNCYPYETSTSVHYVQLGCTDGDSQSLSVNLYKDNTCQTPNKNAYGMDDTTIDVSSLQPPFKSCHQCVYFVDKNEDDVDDQYFYNRMTNAPLCSGVWSSKKTCDAKCRRLGNQGNKWNSADQMLLVFFTVFITSMLYAISKKRANMAKKDALLEEAAMSAAGLQITHILGILFLTILVTVVFGLMKLKAMTWVFTLGLTFVLFCYLMKLTIDSAFNTPVGPDGEPLEDDSDDDDEDDDDDDEEDGAEYKPPSETKSGKPENLPEIS